MKEIIDGIAGCVTDKSIVIAALTVIGIYALYTMGANAENIITAIVSGLCGIAVGHNLKG